MSFHLYTGNKLERLAELYLDAVFRHPPADPFTPETIVIQTQGMADWLTQFLAANGGIAANLELPYLENFVRRTMLQSFDPATAAAFRRDSELFSQEVMAWRLAALLEDEAHRVPELARYLTGDARKLLQLAAKIAGLFDQYQVYRQEELLRWAAGERGAERHLWQRNLYLALRENGAEGREFYFQKFFQLNAAGRRVPERVSVFGAGAMPPIYLGFFQHLSRFREVNFFYLNPCREYWGERPAKISDAEFDQNPLLASFGRQGREFFNRVIELHELCHTVEETAFEEYVPGGEAGPEYSSYTMLTALQEDILSLRLRRPDGDGFLVGKPLAIPPGDRSVRVFNCHGIRREVEVLHEQLLTLMNGKLDSAPPQPREIIVMAPDINQYEPYIRAVFDQGPLAGEYSISDRSLRSAGQLADTFLRLLELPAERFEASEVTALLDQPALRARFNIPEEALETISRWTGRAAIRWGFDAESHRKFCGVPFEEFTWSQGLDRLLLAFAMTETPDSEAAEGLRELGAIPEGEAELLGNFIRFVRQLAALGPELARPCSPAEWQTRFSRILDSFFLSSRETAAELAALRASFAAFAETAATAGYNRPIPVDAAADRLGSALEEPVRGASFLRGKITFCSLVPMRSIPMQVVAILGLNEGKFPRRESKLGFNVLATPRPGDRSRPAEDRYLFLEAILSARRNLLLFYQGRSLKDGSALPPAVPLTEFLNCMQQSFPGFQVSETRLQGFHPDGFRPDCGLDLRSYSAGNCRAAAALAGAAAAPPPSQTGRRPAPLPPEPLPESIPLDELEQMFSYPCRWFLKNRAGTRFLEEELTLADDEPIVLDPLEHYQLRTAIDQALNRQEDPAKLKRSLLRGGRLPLGENGELLFLQTLETMKRCPAPWREERLPGPDHRILIDLAVGGTRLTGIADGDALRREHWFRRCSGMTWTSLVSLHLRHLLLNVLFPEGVVSFALFFEHKTFCERTIPPLPAAEAEEKLLRLIESFREGMRRPLPVFARASAAYADSKKRSDAERKLAAIKEFRSSRQADRPGDLDDPAIALCFNEADFNDPAVFSEFARLTDELMPPLQKEFS